ncbi:Crotonase superfamily [Syntrophomonas zehnderi OL-4]|uniref:short-chain-enoyl-CoA hydratase n=1 Tax=Syntrophomonas zehnderi OL-4 TaxID=690567 RepID=A0A0E4G912_9FIRM|nr:enoyl-CoA hydratase-related protein [Syntrophomonas zehnderi]CFW96000.1 Crotonase superfamily [Syntrophomonas zehnderi OL-4]
MEYQLMKMEKKEGVGIILFDNAKAMNPTNPDSVRELTIAFTDLNSDPDIKAVLITGGDKVFAAGGDIPYMAEASVQEMEEFIRSAHAMCELITASPKPFVAAIAGPALGGGTEIAVACDIRIAADNAIFGLPEINLGIMPGCGGTQRLGHAIGWSRARYMVLTGEIIDASTALSIGLVNQVVPAAELQESAFKQARALARKSPAAIRAAKHAMNYAQNNSLDSGLKHEQKVWSLLFAGSDQTEGMRAFLEKRRPNYTGR